MTRDQIVELLAQEICRVAPEADLAALSPDADIREELDIDSMDFLNLVTALCERLGIAIPEQDYAELRNFGRACDYLTAKAATAER